MKILDKKIIVSSFMIGISVLLNFSLMNTNVHAMFECGVSLNGNSGCARELKSKSNDTVSNPFLDPLIFVSIGLLVGAITTYLIMRTQKKGKSTKQMKKK
jgi:hypothetical protein